MRRAAAFAAVLAAFAALAIPITGVSAQRACEVEISPSTVQVEASAEGTAWITVSGSGFPPDTTLRLDFGPGGAVLEYRTDVRGAFTARIRVAAGVVYRADAPAGEYRLGATGWEGGEPPYTQPADPGRLCRAETSYTVVSGDASAGAPDTAVRAASAVGVRTAGVTLLAFGVGLLGAVAVARLARR